MHRENRNTPDSSDVSPFIPDNPDIYNFEFSLEFSRHMKTRLQPIFCSLSAGFHSSCLLPELFINIDFFLLHKENFVEHTLQFLHERNNKISFQTIHEYTTT